MQPLRRGSLVFSLECFELPAELVASRRYAASLAARFASESPDSLGGFGGSGQIGAL